MNLLESFDELFAAFRPHFKRQKTFERARALAFALLLTYGRRNVTRLICSKNEQQKDWSADYKFFSLRPWQAEDLFGEILKECDRHSDWDLNAVVIPIDETVCRKSGRKIPGVAVLRDPMSPPYHVNLIPGVRYLQAAAILAPEGRIECARAVPVCFHEAAPAKKPKKNASLHLKAQYETERKAKRITVRGRQVALKLRDQVDQLPNGPQRPLFLPVDGAFCNQNFLHGLPDNVIPIARARKDMKLVHPADSAAPTGKGRRKIYGEELPTPEEIRQDDTYPWQTARTYAAGKYHTVRYKTVAPVLWRRGTRGRPCRLIIIAALRYRKTKNSKLLYRAPAYLLILDATVPVDAMIQFYFLRWDIEVNHRDEKSLLGVGDAQVRAPKSAERNPQFAVLIYSLLLLASLRAYGAGRTEEYLPLPKWRRRTDRRPSTLDILSQFRRQLILAQLQMDLEPSLPKPKRKKRRRKRPRSRIEAKKRGFVVDQNKARSALKLPVNVLAAILYADC